MAGLANKLGPVMPNLTGSAKFLGVQAIGNKVSNANIYSKTSGQLETRPKPWDYNTYSYSHIHRLYEGTTKRFNDNTKLIVIEGPPGLGKSKLAKELADEFDMLYVPNVTMDDYYINRYGYDLREMDHLQKSIRNKSYDEKNFAQDPTGQDGGLDRMQHNLIRMRALRYNFILTHMFNTGQGVVTEKSPFSDYVFSEACYKMGWLDKNSRTMFQLINQQLRPILLRPNLIIHLDAPTDVVQAKLKERANTTHPWEKNSPVYFNSGYLKLLYEDLLKNNYMKKAAPYSRLLTYDWSEGGETEVVVEDIERINLDYFDKNDKQQMDWRMFKEDTYSYWRHVYTQKRTIYSCINVNYADARKVLNSPAEDLEFQQVAIKLPGNMYAYGNNEELGDKVSLFNPFINLLDEQTCEYNLDMRWRGTAEFEAYFKERTRRRLAGEQNWWNF